MSDSVLHIILRDYVVRCAEVRPGIQSDYSQVCRRDVRLHALLQFKLLLLNWSRKS